MLINKFAKLRWRSFTSVADRRRSRRGKARSGRQLRAEFLEHRLLLAADLLDPTALLEIGGSGGGSDVAVSSSEARVCSVQRGAMPADAVNLTSLGSSGHAAAVNAEGEGLAAVQPGNSFETAGDLGTGAVQLSGVTIDARGWHYFQWTADADGLLAVMFSSEAQEADIEIDHGSRWIPEPRPWRTDRRWPGTRRMAEPMAPMDG